MKGLQWRIQQWSTKGVALFFLKHCLVALVFLAVAYVIGIFTVTPESVPYGNVIASDFGTIAGIVAGFMTSLAIQWIGNYSKRKSTTTSLRKELLAELTAMDDFFQIFEDKIDLRNPIAKQVADNISVDIYQGNIQQFGKMSSVETQAIILYYSSLSNLRALIRGTATDGDETTSKPKFSHERIVELNVIWRLVFDLIFGKIEPRKRPPTRELTNLAKLHPAVIDETIYEDIEEDLRKPNHISAKEAQGHVEDILEEGKLAVDTSQDLKNAIEQEQEQVYTEGERSPKVGAPVTKGNADP